MKIWLIRHGATKGNLEKRYVGKSEEEILGEEKKKLAQLEYPTSDVLYVSPMKRCIETAEILFPGQKYQVIEELRECDFGSFEYKNYMDLKHNSDYQEWIDGGGKTGFPGGETLEEYQTRSMRAMQQVIENNEEEQSVTIVAHGGTIMAVLDQMVMPHRDYFEWQSKNGEGYLISVSKQEYGFGRGCAKLLQKVERRKEI